MVTKNMHGMWNAKRKRREDLRREEKRGRNCRRVANRALRAGQLNKKLNLKEAESRRREGGEKEGNGG